MDKSYHRNLATLNQQNPLVHNLLLGYRPSTKKARINLADKVQTDDELARVNWRDTYSLVCNMANLYNISKKTSKAAACVKEIKVTELEKLCIALHMSYGSNSIHMDYVYKPKYMVYDELCMVVRNNVLLNEFFTKLCSDTFINFPN